MEQKEVLGLLDAVRNDQNYKLVRYDLRLNCESYIYVNETEKVGYSFIFSKHEVYARKIAIENMGKFFHKQIDEDTKRLCK